MAVRSAAGTGVIVSLVVFVITTVALLILAIVFYRGWEEAYQAQLTAERRMSQYIEPHERNQDIFQRYEAEAGNRNVSVAAHMHQRMESIMRYVDGDPATTLDRLRGRLARFDVPNEGVVANVLQDKHRDLRQRDDRIADLQSQVARLGDENAELNSRLTRMREEHRAEIAAVQDQVTGYRTAAEEHREELNRTKRAMDESVDRLMSRYEGRVDELEREIDNLRRERVVLIGRIDDLQDRLSADRIRAQDPSTLVDGRIIEIAGPAGEVYIDRGRQHRIVLGMTFEVYDDAASIGRDLRTGDLSRGKASIQIVRVGDQTSTARIVRSVPGRPVVRGDVIANAVYDPDYQFKFMVHGMFDIDGDGRATASEREYIERLILDWGGVLVTGDEIPGDLDFLVLGVEPREPASLPPDATDRMIQQWAEQRSMVERYRGLMRQAQDAQIPVLNHNRFLILIGHTPR